MDSVHGQTRDYEGGELRLFTAARNWKRYWAEQLAPFLVSSVLDVGAGMGETALGLARNVDRWTCLEPDPAMVAVIRSRIETGELPPNCEVRLGTLDAIQDETFATILYIDVLEHIEHDAAELAKAVNRLQSGGRVIVLGPAHQWLFSPFDQAIGHYRRYTLKALRALTPPGLRVERAFYLDTVGLAASLTNSLFLKASMPTAGQISFWDRILVPLSRIVDRVHGKRVGKTAVMIWQKD